MTEQSDNALLAYQLRELAGQFKVVLDRLDKIVDQNERTYLRADVYTREHATVVNGLKEVRTDHDELTRIVSSAVEEIGKRFDNETKARTSTIRWATGIVLVFLGSILIPIAGLLIALTRGGPS